MIIFPPKNWYFILLSTFLLFFSQLGCSADQAIIDLPKSLPPDQEGPYTVANTTIEAVDVTRERELTLEIWYPSTDRFTEGESPIKFERDESSQNELSTLYDLAPNHCPTLITHSVKDGSPLTSKTPYPLILFSHCFNCGRYSSFSLAERLASHGMLVISVDHAGQLPFLPTSIGENLSPEQLEVRVQDLNFVTKSALSGELFTYSERLQDLLIDPDRIGVFGHSFGSVTAAFFADQEPLVAAVAGLAAPMQNPLFPGFAIEDLNIPSLLLLAEEDNSIGEIGNRLIRSNFEKAMTPIWKITIADGGHWSLSDLCGLTETFSPGCGSGIRHSDQGAGEVFDYIPVADGIKITQNYLTAFFQAHLEQRQDGLNYLEVPSQDPRVSIQQRP